MKSYKKMLMLIAFSSYYRIPKLNLVIQFIYIIVWYSLLLWISFLYFQFSFWFYFLVFFFNNYFWILFQFQFS